MPAKVEWWRSDAGGSRQCARNTQVLRVFCLGGRCVSMRGMVTRTRTSLTKMTSNASRFSQNGELWLTHWEVSVEEHESEAELEHPRRSGSVGKAGVSPASAGTVKEEGFSAGEDQEVEPFPVTISLP